MFPLGECLILCLIIALLVLTDITKVYNKLPASPQVQYIAVLTMLYPRSVANNNAHLVQVQRIWHKRSVYWNELRYRDRGFI